MVNSPTNYSYSDIVDQLLLGAAGCAKILCSAVFVSGRDVDEALRNSARFLLTDSDRAAVSEVRVDRVRREVEVTVRDRRTRRARHLGDQGCVVVPSRGDIQFRPVPVRSSLPEPSTQPWPSGDAPDGRPWPADVDRRAVEVATARAFADPDAFTMAFLVVHRGRILAERYGPGIDQDTQLESWSMGKTVLASLLGLLVRDGTYRLDQPAPVPAWRADRDPRGGIRIVDLLRMSSGLRCTSPFDAEYRIEGAYPDHLFVYTGAVDSQAYALQRPLQRPPGTHGHYQNCDHLVVGWLVEQAVRRRGEEILTFPQRALFDRIGIRRQVLETDPYGHFLLTGHVYGTARNWARLGLLYLQDGRWGDEQVLPGDWSAFVSTPAPAWRAPIYGASVWLNRGGQLRLPVDAYFMLGSGGQYTIVVPSRELVVVRMGHQRGQPGADDALNDALELLAEAIPRVSPRTRAR
jgi:CubicO group peptidase (beta-lactamase class C family)